MYIVAIVVQKPAYLCKFCDFVRFQYEESGGIPLRILRSKLQEEGATEYFPPGKVEMFIRKADEDADGHLSYAEFVRLVSLSDGLVNK